ncbi:MAG: AmmeMemoRadiSam system protein B, partial [Pseudomonadota bacterium]
MAPQPARFAGSFFTSEPIPLNRQVRLLTQGGKIGASLSDAAPRAIISPHAGYRFSGAIAGQAFASVINHTYERIVILSPSHKYQFDGLAMPSWNQMQLPNGRVTLDRFMRNDLRDQKMIRIEDAAHDNEHGIETQLPFITRYMRDAKILPIVVGKTTVAEVARLVDYLSAPGTLFVLSSDLSHFHGLKQAQDLDAAAARMIETHEFASLNGTFACGWLPVAGYLASNAGAGTRPVRLAMGDSSPVTGDDTRVVGYGAWALYAADVDIFKPFYRQECLRVARACIASQLRKGRLPDINTGTFRAPLQSIMGSFVTLTDQGRLRGCIGSLAPHQPLIHDVAANAVKSAVKDKRFKPLQTIDELDKLKIKVAVLTKPVPISVSSREELERILKPGETGAI